MKTRPHKKPAKRRANVRIAIVDDHPLVRMSLKQAILREPDLMLCGEAEDWQQALKILATTQPDLAIVDLALNGTSGIDLIKEVHPLYPKLQILVFSMHDEALHAERAIRAGARGYISKQEAVHKIMEAIRQVLKGEIYWGPAAAGRSAAKVAGVSPAGKSGGVDRLAKRELEVFKLIGAGQGTRQIAAALQIDASTVETYRARIKEKLDLNSSNALIQQAIRWHMTHADEDGEGAGGDKKS